MIKVQKGTPRDFEEIIDFGNYVFSHSGSGTDFPSLLPKLYKKEYEMEQYHYLIKENDRIRAMVGAFPLKVQVLDTTLNISGIGTVSAHPYDRGKGYMTALMTQATEDMKQNEVDMSILSGRKDRYEHFGYAVVGTKLQFSVSHYDSRNYLGEESKYSFVQLKGHEEDVIAECYQLHQEQQVRYEREVDKFYDICCTWTSNLVAIYKEDVFVGYLITNSGKNYIPEIVLRDTESLREVLGYYIKTFELNGVSIVTGAYEYDKVEQLTQFSEGYSIGTPFNCRVFNFKNVIEAYLKLKGTYTTLLEGSLVLEIKNHGTYEIKVSKENIQVEEKDASADMVLEYFEAMQLIFAPMAQYRKYDEVLSARIKSYFPLPIYICSVDNV